MIEKLLTARLRPIGRRYGQAELLKKLTLCWSFVAATWVAVVWLTRLTHTAVPFLGWVFLAGTFALSLFLCGTVGRITNYKQIARQIEQEDPKLQSLLLAAVEQQPDPETGRLNYLQERVITEALEAHRKSHWGQRIDRQLRFYRLAGALSLMVVLGLLAFLHGPSRTQGHASRRSLSWFKGIEITPGDASVERGSMVAITAKFGGSLPADVKLVTTSSSGTNLVPVAKSLDDPVFGATLATVNEDTLYHFEYGDQRTKQFVLRVFDFPELQRADAQLTYPAYTKLQSKTIPDTRRVTAVQGTKVQYSFQLNKPVRSAKLIARDKSVVELMGETNQPNVFHANIDLATSKHYELQLIDAEKRTNKVPAEFVFEVLTNAAPVMKLASPRGDVRVSPLQEVGFEAEISDDFGLGAYGFAYRIAGRAPRSVQMGESAAANEKRSFKFTLPLEDLKLQANDLVSYYVWADDTGPNGETRRNSSDMFFADVRPFEEIFRQAPDQPESSSPQSGQQASKSEKLAELQKEIINATWNTFRRESANTPSPQYPKDAELLRDSQSKALAQLEMMKENVDDARLHSFVETAGEEMIKAITALKEASKSPPLLTTALTFEESAYQALLRLQAREYSVKNQRGKGSGSGDRQQRELDQLDLKESDNRYETQRKALPQNPEQREQTETLNRLKELARRQQDLNDRLQELQNSLQEAKSEPERQKLRDQLKRLREEQRDIVHDVDQLQQRMSQSQNKEQMADAAKKLEQTRQEAQKAAENLQNESVSKALASGARTEQDLKELQQEVRKNSSARFGEEMREMRRDARELAEKEQKIASDLQAMTKPKQRTLSDSGQKQQLTEALNQQKSGLTNLLQQMQQVTEHAENAEPLLSKQLYDTIRKANQQDTEKSLDTASILMNRSLLPQATEFEKQARKTIDEIKSGVEHAAESVLGDETEALRAARRQVDELTSKLEREIASAEGGGTNSPTNILARASESQSTPMPSQKSQSQAEKSGAGEKQNEAGEKGQSDQQAQAGQQPGPGQKPGNGQQSGPSEQPGPGTGKQPTLAQSGKSQSESMGEGGEGAAAGQNGKPGKQRSQAQASTQGGGDGPPGGPRPNNRLAAGGRNFFDGGGSGPNEQEEGPLTGTDFRGWSDRLSEVEEIVENPQVRNDIARVQDRARAVRSEFKRAGKKPDWAVVRSEILSPLVEVRARIDEELSRRQSEEAMVPLDRDAVPAKYTELVRRYYENLGK